MKNKIASLLFVTFLAAIASAQTPSSWVKVGSLPAAGTLTGNELLLMSQSGATVTATINQTTAGALANSIGASNYFNLYCFTNALNIVATSNQLNNVSNTFAANLRQSNTVYQAALNASNSVFFAALQATNAALATYSIGVNNSMLGDFSLSNTLYETQIEALQSGESGSVIPGSQPYFNRVRLPEYVWPTGVTASGGDTTVNVDFSKGSSQVVTVTMGTTANHVIFVPVNWQDGDNVFLEVVCNLAGEVGSGNTITGGTLDPWAGTLSGSGYLVAMSGSVHEAMLNWQVFGSSLVFSATVHP